MWNRLAYTCMLYYNWNNSEIVAKLWLENYIEPC